MWGATGTRLRDARWTGLAVRLEQRSAQWFLSTAPPPRAASMPELQNGRKPVTCDVRSRACPSSQEMIAVCPVALMKTAANGGQGIRVL